MITLLKWGLTLVIAFVVFAFNAFNPEALTQAHYTPPSGSAADIDSVAPSAAASKTIFSTIRSGSGPLNVQELSAAERFLIAVREIVDDGVASVGRSVEDKITFGNVQTRGYVSLIVVLGILGGIGALMSQQRNVDKPNDGPSFSFASLFGKIALITAAFLACALVRDFSVAYTGDAAILAILLTSVIFAIFSASTAFARSN